MGIIVKQNRVRIYMRYFFTLLLILGSLTLASAEDGYPEGFMPLDDEKSVEQQPILKVDSSLTISVTGQGVAPSFVTSPGQAFALAKRAAMVDAYRLIAERVKGVYVEGKDVIKNMVVKSSTVRSNVSAMVKNATIVETTFKDGICEVEMEVNLSYNQFKE